MKLGISTWVKDFVNADNIDVVFGSIRDLAIPDDEGRPTIEVFASDDLDFAHLVRDKAIEYNFRTAALGFFPFVDETGKASPHMTSPDPLERKSAVDTVKKWILFTKEIAIGEDRPVLSGPFHTRHNFKNNKATPSEEFSYLVEGLTELGKMAKEEGVFAGIEILNRFECRGLNKVDDVLYLIKKVGIKNLGIHWDSSHAFIDDKNLIESLETALDSGYLIHAHLSENDRTSAIGKGGIGSNFDIIISKLSEANDTGRFTGSTTVELFCKSFHPTVGIPVQVTDKPGTSYDSMAIAKESMNYIKEQLTR